MDWTPQRIRYELSERGISSLSELARSTGIAPSSLINAQYQPNRKAEAVILSALGVPGHLVWPSRYNQKGQRLQPQPLSNYRIYRSRRQSQKGAAA